MQRLGDYAKNTCGFTLQGIDDASSTPTVTVTEPSATVTEPPGN